MENEAQICRAVRAEDGDNFAGAPFGFQFRVIHEQFEAMVLQDLKEFRLTYSQMFILTYLERYEDHEVSPKEMALALHVTPPTVTGILRRLKERGLVRLEMAPENRRRRVIRLDQAGREILTRKRSRLGWKDELLVAGFSEDEKKELGILLLKVHRNLAEEILRKDAGGICRKDAGGICRKDADEIRRKDTGEEEQRLT